MIKQAEIYIHIPFCVKKCAYCDFLSAPATEDVRKQYVQQLIQEISTSRWAKKGISVPTLFIGGGTPSILAGEDLVAIMNCVKAHFLLQEDAEITIECNPGTLDEEKLHAYKTCGINRISIGLQSANDKELSLLGRIHTYDAFLESYQLARRMGFDNINIDLMSALPGQSLSSYQNTVKQICDLEPEHISAYSLIIEEGTPFYEAYQEDELLREKGMTPKLLPTEEEERAMYEWTKAYLKQRGYERYEISNYAKKGYECRHNVGYWIRHDYIGFGLGAAGLMDEIRYENERNLATYLEGSYEGSSCPLSEKEQMEEFMFLGLRLVQGVSREVFEKMFNRKLEDVYGAIVNNLIQDKLIQETMRDGQAWLELTDYGRDVSNYVLSEFILD